MEREKIVQSWHQRAKPYEKLIEQYSIFSDMAITMIHFLRDFPRETMRVIDLAAGTGLVSRLLIEYFHLSPSQLVLIEPAEQMCDIARESFPQYQIYRSTAEDLLSIVDLHHQYDFILCNASMHLMSEETIYPIIDQLLKPDRGYFLYTLWYHSFDEIENYHNDDDFHEIVNQTLISFGYPIYYSSENDRSSSFVRSRKFLEEKAKKFGFHLHSTTIYKENISMKFDLDFNRMSTNWLNEHLIQHRPSTITDELSTIKSKIIDRILQSIEGKTSKIAFVRIILCRNERKFC